MERDSLSDDKGGGDNLNRNTTSTTLQNHGDGEPSGAGHTAFLAGREQLYLDGTVDHNTTISDPLNRKDKTSGLQRGATDPYNKDDRARQSSNSHVSPSSSAAQKHESGRISHVRIEHDGNGPDADVGGNGGESSTSSSGDQIQTRGALSISDKEMSAGNGSRTSGGNIVTGSAQTTSSGDDRDSSGGNASGNGGATTSEHSGQREDSPRHHHHHHHHHHYHHHHHRSRRRTHNNDGSALQVPGDVGSDQLAGGPATVVASRLLPPPGSDATTNVSSSGSGGEGETQASSSSLLQPHREPALHTIRRTFSKFPRRDHLRRGKKSSATDSSSMDESKEKKPKAKHTLQRSGGDAPKAKKKKLSVRPDEETDVRKMPVSSPNERRRGSPSPESDNSNAQDGGSSGSGTEGGYAGSASSNEMPGRHESSSSPSVSSAEGPRRKSKSKSKRHRPDSSVKPKSDDGSSSSEIADFSSGASARSEVAGGFTIKTFTESPCDSPSLSSSSNGEGSDGLEESYLSAKRQAANDGPHPAVARKRKATSIGSSQHPAWPRRGVPIKPNKVRPTPWRPPIIAAPHLKSTGERPPILSLGSDIMAHVLTFLQPPEILDVLTMPLSRDWRQNFTSQPELWRVLCLVEPFKAKIDDNEDWDSASSSSTASSFDDELSISDRRHLDRFRLLYTSFVRCMKYLSQIREDAMNGRAPSYIDYGISTDNGPQTRALVSTNKNLRRFLARARGVVDKSKKHKDSGDRNDSSESEAQPVPPNTLAAIAPKEPKKRKRSGKGKRKEPRYKIGHSMITERLLGCTASGEPGNLELPWSCAIYSIVNWMVMFSDVEGIQALCLKVLPFLLEDEQQRMTAQRAGLTDIVLRAMVMFAGSVQLHISAFHTIVLLARPLGGREGMLFHSSMVASGIFSPQNSQHRKNGIAVMVDSMRRFENNDVLQAMSCWALVNIALAHSQKAVLVKLGGIQATCNAMLRHPFSAEVQFRALFALINLVIPSVRINGDSQEAAEMQQQLGELNETQEKDVIDDMVGDITNLVVRAMKNFCSSEAILNRACLVLHNLSLTQEYHTTLLWTPNCYQMLEWCLANYRTDEVLQQSATGTLHRLQVTLSNDDDLRSRFAQSLQSQQHASLEQARREAMRLHEQQDELHRRQQQRLQRQAEEQKHQEQPN